MPDASGVAYQAAKSGEAGFTLGMMQEEAANGVRATVIYPGLTDTPLLGQRPDPHAARDRGSGAAARGRGARRGVRQHAAASSLRAGTQPAARRHSAALSRRDAFSGTRPYSRP